MAVDIPREALQEYLQCNKSKTEIGKLFNVTLHTVNRYIRNYNLSEYYSYDINKHSSRINCDITFFDNIDTEEKAYILGFLLADGWITSDGKYVGFCVTESDVDILEKIKAALKSKSKIATPTNSGFKSRPRKTLEIGSIYLVKALVNLGVTTTKSYDARLPTISKHLLLHLLRGLFDGDGSFSNNTPLIVSCSLDLVNDIHRVIFEEYSISLSIYKQEHKQGATSYKIAFKKGGFNILCKMYNQPKIVLSRKMLKFTEYYNYRIKNQ